MVRLILGETTRTLDERYRLSIPTELVSPLADEGGACILAKERPGCLSLWTVKGWKSRLDAGVQLIASKMKRGDLKGG